MDVFYPGSNRYKIEHIFSNISKTSFLRTRWFLKVQFRKIPHQLLESLLKIASWHLKSEIKCIQISRKKKFHKQSVVILLKNGCSFRHMFRTIFDPLFMTIVLEKHVWSSSCLVLAFYKENSYSNGKFTERLVLL